MKLTNQQCEDLATFQKLVKELRELQAEARKVKAQKDKAEKVVREFLTTQDTVIDNGEHEFFYTWQPKKGYVVKPTRFIKWTIKETRIEEAA